MSNKKHALRKIFSFLLVFTVAAGLTGCTSVSHPSAENSKISPAAENRPSETEPAVFPTEAPTEAPETDPEASTEGSAEASSSGNGENVSYAKGYVRVITSTQTGWLPLPENGEQTFPLKQMTESGDEIENVIHLTPNGVYMESATCENQDCVHQGEVTLENKAGRALENMIICLPNQVCLELYSIEELLGPSGE